MTDVRPGLPDQRRRLTAPAVLARGAVTNVLAQVVPLLVGLVLTPFIIHRLGPDAFGLLSLGWTVLALAAVFNLGLGRATTKYAAEYLASGEHHRLGSVFWGSVVLNIALGLVGAALMAGTAVWLIAGGWLKVPVAEAGEATWLFAWLSLALPFTFVTSTLRGMLEAGQHFDESNLAKAVFNLLLFVLPAAALLGGGRLIAIGILLSCSRVVETLVFAWLCHRQFPLLPWGPGRSELRTLLVYGGWLTVTSALLPLILNVDRFAVSLILSVGALAFYSVAADLVMRLAALPSSVVVPLFPAFSALAAAQDRVRLRRLYACSMKYMVLGMAPLVAVLIVWAHPFLHAWLGPDFALRSTRAMQVLAVGLLINSVAYLPYTVLQAVGRPDLTAKSHLVETPVAVLLMWGLTRRYGIEGAALAACLRLALDLGILFVVTLRLGYIDWLSVRAARGGGAAALAVALLLAAGVAASLGGAVRQVSVFILSMILWALGVWSFGLEQWERTRLVAAAANPAGLFAKHGADVIN